MHTACPYCLRRLDEVEEVDEDHVVAGALGGIKKIRTCKRCNSVLGAGVEARLLGRKGLLTPLSQAQGWTAGSLSGETEDGITSLAHLGGGKHLLLQPHVEVLSEDEGRVSLGVRWPSHLPEKDREAYLASLAKQYGGQEATRTIEPAPDVWTTIGMVAQIEDLRRLTAKIALSTGAWKWGDDFTLSPLADWLREVLDVWSEWPEPHRRSPGQAAHTTGRGPLTQEVAESLSKQLETWLTIILDRHSKGLPLVGHVDVPPPVTVFTPVEGGEGTLINVTVLGLVLPTIGVSLPLVPGESSSPVVIVHAQRARGL